MNSLMEGERISSGGENVDFGFPLNNFEAMEDMNNKYKSDASYLVSYLASFGGANLSASTNRLLREILTDDVAAKLAWTGRSKKPGLSTFDFHNAIIDAVRLNRKFKDTARDDIEKSIKSWLNHANERLTRVQRKESFKSDTNKRK